MLEYRPFVPITHGVRVSTAVLSYNGHLYFGITGDYETAADVEILASGASRGIEELCQRALTRLGEAPPGASRSGKSA